MNKPTILFSLLGLLLCVQTAAQTCISHRIILDHASENSLEVIQIALDDAVSGVEFDVQLSRDGIPFLYHDKKLGDELVGAQCPRGSLVEDLDFKDIQKSCLLENGESPPTLKSTIYALKGFKGHIFVDLKPKMNEEFFKIVESSWLLNHEKLRFLSFKKRALRPLRKRWPKAKVILLSRYIPRGLFYGGIGFNKRLNPFTSFFRRLGKDVGIWTLNSEEDISRAIKKRADFIITDDYPLCQHLTNLSKS